MAGMRFSPEDSSEANQHLSAPHQQLFQTGREGASDDDRSVAADSWSIKSDYGSTLDDEQRHADAAEALSSAANFRPASDYSSDKDEPDADAMTSMLGLQSYWDAAYLDELANFREHGHVGEIWFGTDVMDTVISWTKSLCIDVSQGHILNHVGEAKSQPAEQDDKHLSSWSVLDIGTGNGLLLQELSKQGFADLTGTDYSEGAVDLARSLADRDGFLNIKFLVDDILETKLDRQFQLVMDKGTLDAIGLHPDGPIKRMMYWDSVSKLLAPGGILVITSCNNTKDELVQEVENFNQGNIATPQEPNTVKDQETQNDHPQFRYLNHVRTYPTFMFGGCVGSRVATVAFQRN
ncbi:putative S-adenosyl-L-methionine-dependent methyltransferases superfamily protein [Hibiscus syriacus]|uniref:Protein-lysine N-methyltransferase F3Y22_tig00110730pilonHSYRG00076 n=1 Tax=Hibiscus syriacus TaxID=106335 RepID=A0A6A2ZWE8_HIBSY|nr:EEF1A lysine methyltransferase 2-like [Hibiscus syriacus]KAE8695205.1 putative S-adenosyl-L-methionine-dependent methyltransferases superfamily protein [Hibiscus syriacus]